MAVSKTKGHVLVACCDYILCNSMHWKSAIHWDGRVAYFVTVVSKYAALIIFLILGLPLVTMFVLFLIFLLV